MRKHPYDTLLERKRKWTPVQGTKGICREGSEETIKRALAIRHMELPVGTFITEGLEKNVPDNARALLIDNVKDEERHDLALGEYENALGADEQAELEAARRKDVAAFKKAIEENKGVTKLIYSVEANVGGKIAQVGSRLIDMTAKKMADIFFGKFSELISLKPVSENAEIKSEVEISREKKPLNKILIFSSVIIILGIVIYYFS